jgi:hypothetical protein
MLPAEIFEIRERLLTLSLSTARWNAEAIPPVSWQIMKENLPPPPYSEVALSYIHIVRGNSFPGLK